MKLDYKVLLENVTAQIKLLEYQKMSTAGVDNLVQINEHLESLYFLRHNYMNELI